MDCVHDDIQIEIFSRLPVESIIRFKLVCKSWYTLLSLPHFVSKHLAIQSQSDEKLMLLKRIIGIPDDDNGGIEHAACIVSKNNMHDPQLLDLPSTFPIFDNFGFNLIGHCDGLVVISNLDTDIIVCNPATRDFRILPDSCLCPPPIPCDVSIVDPNQEGPTRHKDYTRFLGFGYDKAMKDHKIVRVVTFSWLEAGVRKYTHKAEAFCIGLCFWRELNVIHDYSLPSLQEYKIREPYFDGVYYWLASDHETDQYILFSFHMPDELFRKIPMPMAIQETYHTYEAEVSIGVYNDSIAMYIHRGRVPDCVEIWAVKKVGVKVSWSKQLALKLVVGLIHFIGFWNGSEKEYLYINNYGKLTIYNRDTTESKNVPLDGWMEWQKIG